MARILAARKVPNEGTIVCLDGDELGSACAQDYFVEPTVSKQSLVVVLTNSGHCCRGLVVSMGTHQNLETLPGTIVERL